MCNIIATKVVRIAVLKKETMVDDLREKVRYNKAGSTVIRKIETRLSHGFAMSNVTIMDDFQAGNHNEEDRVPILTR